MGAGLPDLVDCARLAEDGAVLERAYALGELERLGDLLTGPQGMVRARFTFLKDRSGRVAATVAVEAEPRLICQRCMQGFEWRVSARSDVEFADEGIAQASSDHEVFTTQGGLVSLQDLTEEELLLALPIAPACAAPSTCGRAPSGADEDLTGAAIGMRRPFRGLQDLMKKT